MVGIRRSVIEGLYHIGRQRIRIRPHTVRSGAQVSDSVDAVVCGDRVWFADVIDTVAVDVNIDTHARDARLSSILDAVPVAIHPHAVADAGTDPEAEVDICAILCSEELNIRGHVGGRNAVEVVGRTVAGVECRHTGRVHADRIGSGPQAVKHVDPVGRGHLRNLVCLLDSVVVRVNVDHHVGETDFTPVLNPVAIGVLPYTVADAAIEQISPVQKDHRAVGRDFNATRVLDAVTASVEVWIGVDRRLKDNLYFLPQTQAPRHSVTCAIQREGGSG